MAIYNGYDYLSWNYSHFETVIAANDKIKMKYDFHLHAVFKQTKVILIFALRGQSGDLYVTSALFVITTSSKNLLLLPFNFDCFPHDKYAKFHFCPWV